MTFNHFFPATFERERKHIQLPAGIDTNRDTILGILHDHLLLVQNIWPSFTIKFTSSVPDTTVFALEKRATIASIEKKATFTNFDDGVTILEELGSSGISYLIRWTVTKTTYNQLNQDSGSCTAVGRPAHPTTAPGHYSLEETCTISGDRLLGFLSRFDDDDSYDRDTERLLKFLARIAAGEVSYE